MSKQLNKGFALKKAPKKTPSKKVKKGRKMSEDSESEEKMSDFSQNSDISIVESDSDESVDQDIEGPKDKILSSDDEEEKSEISHDDEDDEASLKTESEEDEEEKEQSVNSSFFIKDVDLQDDEQSNQTQSSKMDFFNNERYLDDAIKPNLPTKKKKTKKEEEPKEKRDIKKLEKKAVRPVQTIVKPLQTREELIQEFGHDRISFHELVQIFQQNKGIVNKDNCYIARRLEGKRDIIQYIIPFKIFSNLQELFKNPLFDHRKLGWTRDDIDSLYQRNETDQELKNSILSIKI